MLKLRFASPEMLVDINELPDLGYHERDADGTIRVGALCRHADLERSSLLAQHQPTMRAAAHQVADPIVRNRGTLVGSLCHADPQGDWASVMMALDGHVVAHGARGRRSIPIRELVSGPFQNTLAYDEVAVEAVIPPPQGEPSGGYLKLERRVGDFATAGVAVAVDRVGGVVKRAGIGLTGVGGSTIAADDAARALVGGSLTAESIGEAAELAAAAAQPHTDHRGSADFKRQLVRVFTTRLLTGLMGRNEEAA
jgi:carbon-monoxide dehydrogenase medium subunit